MPYVTIIAKFKLLQQPGRVKNELLSLVDPTRKEKGCVDYKFYQDDEDDSVLMLYENWESEEDLQVHMSTNRFKETFARIEGHFELTVHKLTEIK